MSSEDNPARSFRAKETKCEKAFLNAMNTYECCFHLHTPNDLSDIFLDKEDFSFAMNSLCMSGYECPKIKILTFEIMNNHLHLIAFGKQEDLLFFFDVFKKRLQRYFSSVKSGTQLSRFMPKFVQIDNLESLRTHIVYTNRNNFVVDPNHTPFSYPYGAGRCYFSPDSFARSDSKYGDMNVRERRNMLHTHVLNYPDSFVVTDGYFSPVNTCDIRLGESLFRDARHYFYKVSRDIEAMREVADLMADKEYYTDDELYSVIFRLSKSRYQSLTPAQLPKTDKFDLARTLHYDYSADNKKIARLLKLDIKEVDDLFPMNSK